MTRKTNIKVRRYIAGRVARIALYVAAHLAMAAFAVVYAWNLLTPPSWRFWGPEIMALLKWPFVVVMVYGISEGIKELGVMK